MGQGAKRKEQTTKPKRKTTRRTLASSSFAALYGTHISEARVKSYSAVMLTAIKRELGSAIFFTRDDILRTGVFNHVATTSQISLISVMVRYLASQGDLVIKSRTNLCLINREKAYSDIPLRVQYFDTISGIVSSMPARSVTSVGDIVSLWRTDPHLTADNKKVAVRTALPRLVKDGFLARKDDFEYIVRTKS